MAWHSELDDQNCFFHKILTKECYMKMLGFFLYG